MNSKLMVTEDPIERREPTYECPRCSKLYADEEDARWCCQYPTWVCGTCETLYTTETGADRCCEAVHG